MPRVKVNFSNILRNINNPVWVLATRILNDVVNSFKANKDTYYLLNNLNTTKAMYNLINNLNITRDIILLRPQLFNATM